VENKKPGPGQGFLSIDLLVEPEISKTGFF